MINYCWKLIIHKSYLFKLHGLIILKTPNHKLNIKYEIQRQSSLLIILIYNKYKYFY
jgi:hypothetical protein